MTRKALLVFLAVVTGCAGETADHEVGSRAAAVGGVTWMNAVGVDAVDNDLTKTATQVLWNAGAASVETISGDGDVAFTTGESTGRKMIGLSNGDTDQSSADIDYAVSFKGGRLVDIVEAGVVRAADVTTYQAGDIFRVQVLAGVVTYWKNGTRLRTSAVAPTFPLGVDTSLRTPGTTFQNVYLESLAFWTNLVGAEAVASELTKTGAETKYDAGGSSLAALDGDGYAEFTTAESTTNKVIGLNQADRNQSVRDIDFGIFLHANGTFSIKEQGVDPAGGVLGTYEAWNIFRVESSGGVVTYSRNREVFYTSAVTPSRRLVLDAALKTPGATVRIATLVPTGECSLPTEVLAQPEASWPSASMAAEFGRLVVAHTPGSPVASRLGPAAVYRRLPSGWIREQVLVDGEASGSGTPGAAALLGNTIAIGNPRDGDDGDGSIRVFERDGSQWTQTDYFDGCPQLYNNEGFGTAVALRANIIAVGNGRDRVYIYRRTATGWRWEAWLEPESEESVNFFGRQLAVGGSRVFVSWTAASGGTGVIYVYVYDDSLPAPAPPFCGTPRPGKWVLEDIIESPNPQAGDRFPSALDVGSSGTTLLAGNPQLGQEDPDTGQPIPNGPGEVYVFERTPSGWMVAETLTGSAAESGAGFGYSLSSVQGRFAVIGAPYQGPGDEGTGDAPGGAYLFWSDNGSLTEVSRLVWPGPLASRQYGGAVAATTEVGVTDTAFVYQTGDVDPGGSAANITVHEVDTCDP